MPSALARRPPACPTRCRRRPTLFRWRPPSVGRGQEQVRVGLGVFDLIAGDHRRAREIYAERLQYWTGRVHPATCRDGPGYLSIRQRGQQCSRAGERSDVQAGPLVGPA